MKIDQTFLSAIKEKIKQIEPEARVILYGSFARGDANEESDIDLLILVDKENFSYKDKWRITDPLYELALEKGKIISALVQSRQNWERKYFYTPLFHNIKREGVEL
jgi:predicted nucleotidyltransferase